ncbi:MAG: FxsA family protein [Deltaproteobacteria bacterium]|nr:FxsA family protein [Deltaproteobacteria bacterium]
MGTLLLLFIALPALELMLLIELGQRIGTLETVGVIVLTGVVGASMARNQGLRVLSYVQQQVAAGQMPTDALVDGIMILLASALLITPGILTDAFGFLCLIPGTVLATVQRRAGPS